MRSERQSERTHTGFQTQRTRTAPIGCILAPISVQARRKGHKRAGQNPKKEKIDRLEKISAHNFEGPQWARITASVTITLKRSSPTPAMRSGVLLLIAGLLGFGMFVQFLYASYSPVSYFRRREKCAEFLPTWYPAVVYWKNIGYLWFVVLPVLCVSHGGICLWYAIPSICFILDTCCTGSRASAVLRTWQPRCFNQCNHFITFLLFHVWWSL